MATKLINDNVDVMTTRELFKGYLLTEGVFLLFNTLLVFRAVILRLLRDSDIISSVENIEQHYLLKVVII